MSKWLPTILPILSLVGVTASPFIQSLLGAHPVAFSIVTTLGLIINHWITPPNAAPTK